MSLLLSVVLAFAFALIGSIAWGVIQWHTGFLAGPIAYGIGWGAATGVLLGNGKRYGPIAAAIAVAIAILGVVMAKVCVLLVAQLDGTTFDDWFATLAAQFGWLDAVWFALAIWPAWATAAGRDRPSGR
jgi:hypothetical protein